MRDMNTFRYLPPDWKPVAVPGAVKTVVVNNVPTSWAIARPVSAPSPQYSPPVGLWRPENMSLAPRKPKVMMDPSDQSTWQRQYRFT